MNPTMDAIYILSPQPHIVDCLLADFDRRRYKKSFLVWIDLLDPQLRRRIDSSPQAQQHRAGYETLYIDFFPRESHLITFRDPWSFPILYHPACNHLVREHMQNLAQKVGAETGPMETVCCVLTPWKDHWHLRIVGRVSKSPLLPTKESSTRS